MPKVFISATVGRIVLILQHHIYVVLRDHYGADSVVFDVDTIPIGATSASTSTMRSADVMFLS